MRNKHPLATSLSLLFLALMLASLGGRFWAVEQAWQKIGPTHIAVRGEQVYLFAAGELMHLSLDGELLHRWGPEQTGLNDEPIDLRVVADGRLLLAEQQPARIRLCEPQSWVCEELAGDLGNELRRQFKVLPGKAPYEWLVTDAPGDTLWGVRQEAGEPQRLLPDDTLAGPNDLAFDVDGNVWVADTDRRRIVELKFMPGGGFEPGREHSAVNHLTVDQRFYPIMLAAAPDGLWWVIQAADFSDGSADLVTYHPDAGVTARFDLPGSVYPTDIAAADGRMLVTDLDQFAVYTIDTSSQAVSVFGGAAFTDLMSALKVRKDRFLRMSTLALAGVIVFGLAMLAAALKATPADKRWTRASSAIDFDKAGQHPAETTTIHWLLRDGRAERASKWAERFAYLMIGSMLVLLLVIYGWALSQAGASPGDELGEKLNELGLLLLLCALVLVAAIPLLRFALRPLKYRLGSDGRRLYLRLADGREQAASPSELAYTDRALLFRQYAVPLQTQHRRNIYLEGEVENWLLPLLKDAEKITVLQAFKRQWQQRDDLLLWSVISGVVLGLLLVLLSIAKT